MKCAVEVIRSVVTWPVFGSGRRALRGAVNEISFGAVKYAFARPARPVGLGQVERRLRPLDPVAARQRVPAAVADDDALGADELRVRVLVDPVAMLPGTCSRKRVTCRLRGRGAR